MRISTILRLVVVAFAALLYVWVAAVRSLPQVRRRKALRRRESHQLSAARRHG